MVFVTAGYSGKRFVFEKAKALGVSKLVITTLSLLGILGASVV